MISTFWVNLVLSEMTRLICKKQVSFVFFIACAQALMPLIGYLLGQNFKSLIENIDHWLSFLMLAVIGINMIRESREEVEKLDESFGPKAMFPLAIADSIDALAVGVTFAFMLSFTEMLFAIAVIGVTTFLLSTVGVKIGSIFGAKYKSKAEFLGGVILILLGLKMLLEGLGVINF